MADFSIVEYLGEPEVLAQLAEEASELAQAALKLRRVLEGQNPTPKTEEVCRAELLIEVADVELCLGELGFMDDNLTDQEICIIERKRRRWIPCSERMPELIKNNLGIEYSETVFALTNGRKIMAAFLRRVPGDKAIWIAPFNFWEAWDEEITHWTAFPPLPEPPEEGESEQ